MICHVAPVSLLAHSPDVRGIARIDQHRIDAGLLAAGDTEPLPALGHMPQRFVQRPGFAAVIGPEKPARHCACPNSARNPARFERPDLAERPGMGILTGILGLGRECRHGQLTPVSGAVAAPQLGSEMAKIQCGIDDAVGNSQHGRNRIAEKLYIGNVPDAVMAREFEQAFVGPDMEPLCHPLLPLASGQRLKNVDLVILRDHIRQPRAIVDRPAIDIDRDVPSQGSLIIQHITTQPRLRRKHRSERLGYCGACHLR